MNACLIMGHKNPLQIIRFAKRLRGGNSDVFIHLDCLMPEEEAKKVIDYVHNEDGVYFCGDRIHGVLDRRSLVDIAFIMIDEAKSVEEKEDKHYGYYLLFSGQDYPIKKMDFIDGELRKNYPKPYIDCTPYDRTNWIYHKFVYCESSLRYHDWITSRFKRGILRSGLRATAIIWTKLLSKAGVDSRCKLTKLGADLYGGSAWWILPDKAIDFILERYHNCDEISELVLNESATPEETYFQIMAMRSPLSDMIEVNPKDMVLQNCKTWAYFFDEDKEFQGHPYVFTMKEIDRLRNSDFWFARKFDITVDADIMDILDNKI